MDKLLDIVVALANLFWFSSSVYHYTFYLKVSDPETTTGCTVPWPVSLIISEFIFTIYSFCVLMLLFLGLLAVYIYYKDVLVHDRMKSKLEKLLQDVYFDKDSVLDFYRCHRE